MKNTVNKISCQKDILLFYFWHHLISKDTSYCLTSEFYKELHENSKADSNLKIDNATFLLYTKDFFKNLNQWANIGSSDATRIIGAPYSAQFVYRRILYFIFNKISLKSTYTDKDGKLVSKLISPWPYTYSMPTIKPEHFRVPSTLYPLCVGIIGALKATSSLSGPSEIKPTFKKDILDIALQFFDSDIYCYICNEISFEITNSEMIRVLYDYALDILFPDNLIAYANLMDVIRKKKNENLIVTIQGMFLRFLDTFDALLFKTKEIQTDFYSSWQRKLDELSLNYDNNLKEYISWRKEKIQNIYKACNVAWDQEDKDFRISKIISDFHGIQCNSFLNEMYEAIDVYKKAETKLEESLKKPLDSKRKVSDSGNKVFDFEQCLQKTFLCAINDSQNNSERNVSDCRDYLWKKFIQCKKDSCS
ncbi:MAG TPA: hypothetical protein H9700_08195 [Candidatus Eisenbergiella intestinipullorum]|nr:hypothetical protein [Candidatus Eisenbergiella intestinipullorum]